RGLTGAGDAALCLLPSGVAVSPCSSLSASAMISKLGVGIEHVFLAAEAMHPERPLQPHHRAFDGANKRERKDKGSWRPDDEMCPCRPVGDRLHGHERADDDVPHNDDHKIGRQVVRAVMVHLLAAFLAALDRLEKGTKEPTAAATGAMAEETAPRGFIHRPRLRFACFAAAENSLLHHRLLPLPGDRSLPLDARAILRLVLCSDRVEPGRRFGSLIISKRMAPASGATSTSRTSTASPSW